MKAEPALLSHLQPATVSGLGQDLRGLGQDLRGALGQELRGA